MGPNNNGGNRRKLEAVQEEPFPEQRGEYRTSFKFEGREFPLVNVVQFSEPISGIDLFLDMYQGLFPNASYNNDERKGISSLHYGEAEWDMHGIFDNPLLIMTSKRIDGKLLKKREPIFAAVVKYKTPLSTDNVLRDIVFNNPIKEAGIYSRQELADKIRKIVENR